MRIKLFNCHHAVPTHRLTEGLFATLVSGLHDAPDGSYLGDLGGDNIAHDNAYTELRHQYYVWKNLLRHYDYVGFEHYRRMFFIDPMPYDTLADLSWELADFRRTFAVDQHKPTLDIGPDPYEAHWRMRRQFDRADTIAATAFIAGHDIITQRPQESRSLEEQWKSCLPSEWWDLTVAAFRQARYFQDRPCLVDFGLRSPVWHNMYIMRSSLFDEYMTLLWDCFAVLTEQIEPLRRGWGHHSERIFNFYLCQKAMEDPTLRVGRLPFLLRSAHHVPPLENDLTEVKIDDGAA